MWRPTRPHPADRADRPALQTERKTAMIMAVLLQKDGAPNPKRHIHAGSAREWAMIMGVPPVGGGRTNPPTWPTRAPALSSSGRPICDTPSGSLILPRLATRRAPGTNRRACGLLTEAPAQPPRAEACLADVTGPPAQCWRHAPSPPTAPIATGHGQQRCALRARSYAYHAASAAATDATSPNRSPAARCHIMTSRITVT
jgi:hypothetical protein